MNSVARVSSKIWLDRLRKYDSYRVNQITSKAYSAAEAKFFNIKLIPCCMGVY